MDIDEMDWGRLDRYVSEQGTPEELAELERWVNADPELRALAEAMRTAGRPTGQEPSDWNVQAAWQRVHRRMRWVGRPPLQLGSGSPNRWRLVPSWRAAAAAAIVLGAAGSSLLLLRSTSTSDETVATAPAREVLTGRGERAAFNLADGTRVMLGAESRLTIPAAYNQPRSGRELHLEGEGYFLVTHDSLRPFLVHTPLGTAEDLGTEFVVTTYPEAHGMRVVVASGKVALRQRSQTPGDASLDSIPLVTLTEGSLARLDSAGTATVTRVDPSAYIAWTQGALVFNGTPLRDVLPRLARWYDVDLRLADSSIAARRLTATFREQSLSAVLDLMELSLGLRVERAGGTVVLHPSSSPR
jgi:transmembrane sensor